MGSRNYYSPNLVRRLSPAQLEAAADETDVEWGVYDIGDFLPISLVEGVDNQPIPVTVVSVGPDAPTNLMRIIVGASTSRGSGEFNRLARRRGFTDQHFGPTWTAVAVDAQSHPDDDSVVLLASPNHLDQTHRRIEITVDSDPSTIIVDDLTLTIDELAANLDGMNHRDAPAFVIRADRSSTFAELLSYHSILDEWFAINFDDPMLFVLD